MATQNLVDLTRLLSLPENGGYQIYTSSPSLANKSLAVLWTDRNTGQPLNITGWSFALQYSTYDLDASGEVTSFNQWTTDANIIFNVVSASTGVTNLFVPSTVLNIATDANTINRLSRLVVIRIAGTFQSQGYNNTELIYVGFRVFSDVAASS